MDYRFGSIVQALSNIHRDTKKRLSPFALDECTITFGESEDGAEKPKEAKRTPWQAMKETAKTVAALFNKPGKNDWDKK